MSDGAADAGQQTAQDGRGTGPEAAATAAAGLAAYCWTLANDEIVWSSNATPVLSVALEAIRAGRGYASLVDPASHANRHDAVMAGGTDAGEGVPLHIDYVFRPGGREDETQLWLEDQGRWFAGPDGRPAQVLGIVRRIDERHRRRQALSALSLSDPLTGMTNRPGLIEALDGAIAAAGASSCAMLLAMIGNLGVVSEAYGFEVAEEVMAEAGRRLAAAARSGDLIARFSGSKFGLILPDCGEDDMASAAERFLAVLRESVVETRAGPVWALLSIGAVVLPRHGQYAATAVAHAEEALAQARKQPFDGFAIYRPCEQRLSERSSNALCASVIVRCLKEERLCLAFQPVIDARNRKPVFHEALLRLADEAGAQIPAGRLVPVAEKLGLVRLINRAVLDLAVAALHSHPEARISINVSGTTATDPRWYPGIIAMLAANQAVASRLIVEITETVALGDLSDTTRFVQQLCKLGVMVAIDDFGAGYTSFRNLRAMPVEMLKIDGSFCRDLAGNADNRYLVRALIDLARAFGLRTVAEWVENESDAELLEAWGIDMLQGNLFGHAEPLAPWPCAGTGDWPPPPPAEETLALFAAGLDGEVAKLRQAVRLLDHAFHARRRAAG